MLVPVCVCLLYLCSLSQSQQCDQPLINNVADFLMHQLISKYPDNIRLANISSSFLYDHGKVEASFGNLARLSSIRRRGDVMLKVYNNSVNIVMQVSFLYLTVSYEEYKVKLPGLSTTGSLETTVMDNLIQVDATMGEKSLCFVNINSVKFLRMGDFEVRLRSSCKLCSSLTSSVTSSALNYFKSRIRSLVEAKVNDTLYRVIKPDNPVVCKTLHLYYSGDYD